MSNTASRSECNRNGCTVSRHLGNLIYIIGNKHYCKKCVEEFTNMCPSGPKSLRQWTAEFESFAKTPVYVEMLDAPITFEQFIRHANTCVIGGHNTLPLNQPQTLEHRPPTDAELHSACLSYRNDFLLLHPDSQSSIRGNALEWLRAWQQQFTNLTFQEHHHGNESPTRKL